MTQTLDDELPVDVPTLMEHIRQQVWADRFEEPPTHPDSIPPEIFAQLVRLRELATQFRLEPWIQPASQLILGKLLSWLRTQIHRLTLFYLRQVIHQEVQFNQTLVCTLTRLAEHQAMQNQALRAEITALKIEIVRLKATSSRG